MKALKEKRLSLRSFLRGGIVILSLLALAFVACNTSGGDETTPTGPGGTDPGTSTPNPSGPVPTEPPITAVYIRIEGASSADNYQGLPPNLAGFMVRVVWSNGTSDIIEATAANLSAKGLYPVPNYCDVYGEGAAAGEFRIAHNMTTNYSSNPVNLKGVIPIAVILPPSASGVNWYSDRPPDMRDIKLTAVYAWDGAADAAVRFQKTPDANVSNPPGAYTRQEKEIPTTYGYPVVVMPDKSKTKEWVAYINRGGTNEKSAKFTLANYYQVVSVEYVDDDPDTFYILDDESKYVYLGLASSNFKPNSANSDMVKKLTLINPKFKVNYTDNAPSRTIDWNEFRTNVLYATDNKAKDDDFFIYRDASGESINGSQYYNTDTEMFEFRMMYVPIEFGVGGYNGGVDVRIAVYAFDDLDPVTPKYPAAQTYAFWQSSPVTLRSTAGTTSSEKLGKNVFDLIDFHWKLTGAYAHQGKTIHEEIKLTPAMFNNARGANAGVALWGTGVLSGLVSNYTANAPGQNSRFLGGLSSGMGISEEERDWPLPLTYRGATLTDAEETVRVILQVVGPIGQDASGAPLHP